MEDLMAVKRNLTDPLTHDIASAAFYWKPEPGISRGKASVLVPLLESEKTIKVLLTKRSMRLSSHKGEVCFPGGKADDTDKDETETALREANEEIGLTSDVCDVITQLPVTLSKHGLVVTPIVAFIPSEFVPVVNEREVETAFTVPLGRFLQSEGHQASVVSYKDNPFFMHFFECKHLDREETFTVFGLTGHICMTVAVAAYRRMPEFQLDPLGGETTIETRLRKTLETSAAQLSQL